ncbi:MAG: hypothetical protein QOG34_1033 [Frankiaceae bacterium]|jgi:hypothetical protein|nr:hypothetical protein [Frankiaceae bacterium]
MTSEAEVGLDEVTANGASNRVVNVGVGVGVGESCAAKPDPPAPHAAQSSSEAPTTARTSRTEPFITIGTVRGDKS